MADERPDDGEAGPLDVLLDGGADVPDPVAGKRLLDPDVQRLPGDRVRVEVSSLDPGRGRIVRKAE